MMLIKYIFAIHSEMQSSYVYKGVVQVFYKKKVYKKMRLKYSKS